MAAKVRILERKERQRLSADPMKDTGTMDIDEMVEKEVTFNAVRKRNNSGNLVGTKSRGQSFETLKMEIEKEKKLFEQFRMVTEQALDVVNVALGKLVQQTTDGLSRMSDVVAANRAKICEIQKSLVEKTPIRGEENIKAEISKVANDIWKDKTSLFFSKVQAKIDKDLREARESVMQLLGPDVDSEDSDNDEDWWSCKGKGGKKGKGKGTWQGLGRIREEC